MKKTKTLITTFLMLQASCPSYLQAWTPEQEEFISQAVEGREIQQISFLGQESHLHADLLTIQAGGTLEISGASVSAVGGTDLNAQNIVLNVQNKD